MQKKNIFESVHTQLDKAKKCKFIFHFECIYLKESSTYQNIKLKKVFS